MHGRALGTGVGGGDTGGTGDSGGGTDGQDDGLRDTGHEEDLLDRWEATESGEADPPAGSARTVQPGSFNNAPPIHRLLSRTGDVQPIFGP
ncbi:hypothetical protein GCM10019017_31110 [Streptomyces showdoensis]